MLVAVYLNDKGRIIAGAKIGDMKFSVKASEDWLARY